MLDNWQRIEQIIKWTGAASVSAFAREIGLNRGENLYQIKRGNNGISKELAQNITSKYPAISKAWLLTGEGDMVPGKGAKERYDIAFYKADAVELISSVIDGQGYEDGENEHQSAILPEIAEPAYYISFPMMRGCEFAAFTFSDAMQPEIPGGSTLFFQGATPENIVPGGTYLVISHYFNGIRYIRKEVDSCKLRLVPKNTEDYDDIIIDISDIEKLYQVKGTLINK